VFYILRWPGLHNKAVVDVCRLPANAQTTPFRLRSHRHECERVRVRVVVSVYGLSVTCTSTYSTHVTLLTIYSTLKSNRVNALRKTEKVTVFYHIVHNFTNRAP